MRIRLQTYFVVNSFVICGISSQREPFEDTLLQLERFNTDIRQKYRSIGMMDEFNHIVTNMIGSLQEVQTKGEDMVTKIKTQEEKLERVVRDIESKEEYIKQVQFEMNQIDEINERIKSELERTKEEKLAAQRELNMVWEKQKVIMEDIREQSAIIEAKKRQEEEQMNKFRTIAADREKDIEGLKEKLAHYEFLIEDASGTLSNLNKEVEPSALESIASRNEVIYPALLVSLIFNLLTGGFVIKVLAPMFSEMLDVSRYDNEEWREPFPPSLSHHIEKPHTMYDTVLVLGELEKESEKEETFLDRIGEEEETEEINEINTDKEDKAIKKIRKLKRKSFIHQNLYSPDKKLKRD